MFFEITLLLQSDVSVERRHQLRLLGPDQGDGLAAETVEIQRWVSAAEICRIGGRICDDHVRRFEALGAMHRHHSDGVRAFGGIALNLDIASGEPAMETLERGN